MLDIENCMGFFFQGKYSCTILHPNQHFSRCLLNLSCFFEGLFHLASTFHVINELI